MLASPDRRRTTRRRRRTLTAVVAAWLTAGLTAAATLSGTAGAAPRQPHHEGKPAKPTKVVYIVLDQLRPEFITAFDMRNVQRLMRSGTSYPNAYLGHMASETVISHNVMSSGMLPKHMGWSDEWYRDVDGVLGSPGDMYVSGSMGVGQFDALIAHRGYPKIADYLEAVRPDGVVAAIGEKTYATYSLGGPGADLRITFNGRAACPGGPSWRGPTGPYVPDYVATPCGRFWVNTDSALSYGTADTPPADMYPLAGNRDVPGFGTGLDPAHVGGDVWVTDAAFAVMDHEDWSGLLLTYGGIDKAGHMWGGLNDVPPYPGTALPETHMAHLAKVADQQVGRVIAKLRADGELDNTLVVLTTDHAQNTAVHYHGQPGPSRGNFNWYYGKDADETYLDPQPLIAGYVAATGGNVRASMHDSALRSWLADTSLPAKRRAADALAELPDVRAAYYRVGDHYRLRWEAPRSDFGRHEWRWHRQHSQEIVDTAAADYGPDVIALLADDTSYGVAGDHGGAQESVQRIPVAFYGAGVEAGARPHAAIRSVDIMPTVLRAMGIRQTTVTDGRAYRLP